MLTLLLACPAPTNDSEPSDSATEDPCQEGTPAITIGTGEFEWEDLNEGDDLLMVHGPQGGWHMLGSVRVENLSPNLKIDYRIVDHVSGVTVSDNNYFVQQVDLGDCQGEVVGRYGYLNELDKLKTKTKNNPPQLLACHDVTLTFDVEDTLWKKQVSASIDVRAIPDPKDGVDLCP